MPCPSLSFEALTSGQFSELSAQTWVLPVGQPKSTTSDEEKNDDKPVELSLEGPALAAAQALGVDVASLTRQWQEDGFKAGAGSTWLWRNPEAGKAPQRVLFLGLGKAGKRKPSALTKAYEAAVKSARKFKDELQSLALVYPAVYAHAGGTLANEEQVELPVTTEAMTLAIVDAVYEATYQSLEAKKPLKDLPTVTLVADDAEAIADVLDQAKAYGSGRALTKDLVNMPANIKTTQTMVDTANALKEEFPFLEITVQDDPEWIKKEMPCFYSVARGSLISDPPKFIRLHYKGDNPSRKIALVGKSVIFDTGGYQVKPGNFMNTMKGDMAGGGTVLGALKTICYLKPEHLELDVYLAATPNKIDSDALIPDSILDTTCGKKVEMRHTDAEGRLTLIDAVAKAELENPEVIVTVATLTGAAMRAVGRCIALMSNNTDWRNQVESAARQIDEPVQALDILASDFENIESKLDGADIRNTSKSDNRGAQTAGAFVMSGVKETQPLVHLDIAGADMWQNETASALSVRSLATFLLNTAD